MIHIQTYIDTVKHTFCRITKQNTIGLIKGDDTYSYHMCLQIDNIVRCLLYEHKGFDFYIERVLYTLYACLPYLRVQFQFFFFSKRELFLVFTVGFLIFLNTLSVIFMQTR